MASEGLGAFFACVGLWRFMTIDRKSTRLNSSHSQISYAVFCLKKKNTKLVPAFQCIRGLGRGLLTYHDRSALVCEWSDTMRLHALHPDQCLSLRRSRSYIRLAS